MKKNILVTILMSIFIGFTFVGCKHPVTPTPVVSDKPYFRVTFNSQQQKGIKKSLLSKSVTFDEHGIPNWIVQYQKKSINYTYGGWFSPFFIEGSDNYNKYDSGKQTEYDTAEHANVIMWDIVASGTVKDENGNETKISERIYRYCGETDDNSKYQIDTPFDMMAIRNPILKISNQKYIYFDELHFKFIGLENVCTPVEGQKYGVFATTYRSLKDGETANGVSSSINNDNPVDGIYYFPTVSLSKGVETNINGKTADLFPFNVFWSFPSEGTIGVYGSSNTPFIEIIYTTKDTVKNVDGDSFDLTKGPAMIDISVQYYDSFHKGLRTAIIPTYFIHLDEPIKFIEGKYTNINVTWNPTLEKRYTSDGYGFYTWPVNDPIPLHIEVYYSDLTQEVAATAVTAEIPTDNF